MLYGLNFSQGFATLSQSLRHDPAAITAHLKQILNFFHSKFQQVKKLDFMSDGPTTQYRNRKIFYIITQYFPLCYPQTTSYRSISVKLDTAKAQLMALEVLLYD